MAGACGKLSSSIGRAVALGPGLSGCAVENEAAVDCNRIARALPVVGSSLVGWAARLGYIGGPGLCRYLHTVLRDTRNFKAIARMLMLLQANALDYIRVNISVAQKPRT